MPGSIGFIGLIVPHLVRLAVGNDQRLLLPASVLAGGPSDSAKSLLKPGAVILAAHAGHLAVLADAQAAKPEARP